MTATLVPSELNKNDSFEQGSWNQFFSDRSNRYRTSVRRRSHEKMTMRKLNALTLDGALRTVDQRGKVSGTDRRSLARIVRAAHPTIELRKERDSEPQMNELRIGRRAPTFSLETVDGSGANKSTVSLDEYLDGWLVLLFLSARLLNDMTDRADRRERSNRRISRPWLRRAWN